MLTQSLVFRVSLFVDEDGRVEPGFRILLLEREWLFNFVRGREAVICGEAEENLTSQYLPLHYTVSVYELILTVFFVCQFH